MRITAVEFRRAPAVREPGEDRSFRTLYVRVIQTRIAFDGRQQMGAASYDLESAHTQPSSSSLLCGEGLSVWATAAADLVHGGACGSRVWVLSSRAL